MPSRIKHIALHTDDPAKTAEWYKEVFGLDELSRRPKDTGDEGVWLSDDGLLAGAPALDGLSDEALLQLLEELVGGSAGGSV